MRIGWLLWKNTLEEFLYFEEKMTKVNPNNYNAKWNITPAKGSRKSSKSLWIYENETGKKRFSVTTSAGAKIQPYFDVPPPDDKYLYHFKVQGVLVDGGLVKVWLTRSTAKYLELLLGSLETERISNAIDALDIKHSISQKNITKIEAIAVPILIKQDSYSKLKEIFEPISDEYMLQQFAIHLGDNP